MAKSKYLDAASALALEAEVGATPGWVSTPALEGHRLGVKCQRSEPPYLSRPHVCVTRDEWLWLCECVARVAGERVATPQPLPYVHAEAAQAPAVQSAPSVRSLVRARDAAHA